MILTKDNIKLGIVLGFLAPLLGMVLFYFYKFNALPFKVYLQYLVATIYESNEQLHEVS